MRLAVLRLVFEIAAKALFQCVHINRFLHVIQGRAIREPVILFLYLRNHGRCQFIQLRQIERPMQDFGVTRNGDLRVHFDHFHQRFAPLRWEATAHVRSGM